MLASEVTAEDLVLAYPGFSEKKRQELARQIRLRMRPIPSNVIPFVINRTDPEATSGKTEHTQEQNEPKPSLRRAVVEARTARRQRVDRDRLEVRRIIRECAIHFGYNLTEFVAHRQTQPIAHHRQIAMYLCRELTTASLPMIGDGFDFRDHTTIMHACRTIEGRAAGDPNLSTTISLLTAKIQNGDV
jgi:chromosomal replication initiation ATPase DnaA